MFEPVQIEHHHGEGRLRCGIGLADVSRNGLLHGLAEPRPVGQPGQAVPIGQLANLGLLGTDVQPHVVKGFGQAANLVLAPQVPHGGVVVTPAQLLGGTDQRAQGRGHTPGRQHAAQPEQHDPGGRNPGQRNLHLTKWCHHFVHRAQHEGLHIASARIQLDAAGHQQVACSRDLLELSRVLQQGHHLLGGQCAHHDLAGFPDSG